MANQAMADSARHQLVWRFIARPRPCSASDQGARSIARLKWEALSYLAAIIL
jgi:hypothetical protein